MWRRFRGLAFALLVLALAGTATLSAQQKTATPATLQSQLDDWFRRAARAAPGQWGVAVGDETGRLLWSVNATLSLIPASTVKLFTTGFARTVLGPEARQVTRVVGTGYADPESGTWIGSWALELNGDATLERPSRSGPMLRDLAAQLAGQGVRRLLGPLTLQSGSGDAESSFPSVWASRHQGRSFAPLIGAVMLNEGLIGFNLAPGKVGQAPYVSASSPEGLENLVTVTAKTVTGRRDRLRISVAPGGRYLVSGTIGAGARVRRYAGTARNARAVLEATWQSALQTAGIEWIQTPALTSASSTFGQLTMAEIVSAPLDSIAAEVNSRSLNIGAEALLLWAGGTMAEGARKLTEHVRLVTGDDIGVHLVDGSGLSTDDRATAYTFLKYLVRFPSTSQGHNFPLLLPANGDGTLKKLSGAALGQGVVRAKTGTLSNVSSLVGYLGHPDGMLVVSVLYNGGSVYAAKQQQWALFKALGAQGTPVFQDVLSEAVLGGEDRTVPPR